MSIVSIQIKPILFRISIDYSAHKHPLFFTFNASIYSVFWHIKDMWRTVIFKDIIAAFLSSISMCFYVFICMSVCAYCATVLLPVTLNYFFLSIFFAMYYMFIMCFFLLFVYLQHGRHRVSNSGWSGSRRTLWQTKSQIWRVSDIRVSCKVKTRLSTFSQSIWNSCDAHFSQGHMDLK